MMWFHIEIYESVRFGIWVTNRFTYYFLLQRYAPPLYLFCIDHLFYHQQTEGKFWQLKMNWNDADHIRSQKTVIAVLC